MLLILLKQATKREFLKWIRANEDLVRRLLNRSYAESGIVYILEVDKKNDPEEIMQAIIKLVPDKKNIIMSAAQKLRLEGMEKGLEKGLEKGKQEGIFSVAKTMLRKGFGIQSIQELTGLNREIIEELQQA